MTGYVRSDVSNNIANGNVIDADELDGEFDAVVSAFNAVTGHTHDGTAAEGAPITVVGPAQDVVVNASAMIPKADNLYDLGAAANEWKDLYVDGVAYLDEAQVTLLTATTANIGTGTITGLTSTTAAIGTLTSDLASIVSSGDLAVANGGTGSSTASGARTNLGVTIGTNVQAWDANLDQIAALATTDGNIIVGNGTSWIVESGLTARTSLGLGTISTQASSSVSITGGSITGITDLAVADGGTGSSTAAGARTNLGLVIGTNVQAWDADLDAFAGKTAPSGTVVGTTDTQTLSAKTLTSPVINTAVTGTALASTAEAQTGTATNKILTPDTGIDLLRANETLKYLSTATFSGGFITLTGFPSTSYDALYLEIKRLEISVDAVVRLEVSEDGGSTWETSFYQWAGTGYTGGATAANGGSNSATAISLTPTTMDAFAKLYGNLHIQNNVNDFRSYGQISYEDTGNLFVHSNVSGAYNGTGTVNAIRLSVSTGVIDGGNVYLWGRETL